MAVRDVVQAAAGQGGGDKLYVEDVFSTYLYTGNGISQTITNGIDLAGEGGMVWLKNRQVSQSHGIFDTERGEDPYLSADNTLAEINFATRGVVYNSDGFTNKYFSYFGGNGAGYAEKYASWTWRKSPKFFDVVTYTGDGSVARSINHNLGSTPGCVMIKATSRDGSWIVGHRSLGSWTAGQPNYLLLDSAASVASSSSFWGSGSADPTDTTFNVGSSSAVNQSGQTYVAYLFAHDAGGFGDDGEQSIISCGSYTGNGSTANGPEINLGWEPQWIMVKNTSQYNDPYSGWIMFDTMRGLVSTNGSQYIYDPYLWAQSSNAEERTAEYISPTATGFKIAAGGATAVNANGSNYIYIAIRRPMKTPESGTEVFNTITRTGTGSITTVDVGFAPDFLTTFYRTAAGQDKVVFDRMRGPTQYLNTAATTQEINVGTNGLISFDMDGFTTNASGYANNSGSAFVNHCFKRAPGFMDVVAYTGTGVQGTSVTHNLGVTPELIICKGRTLGDFWPAYASDIPPQSVLVFSGNNTPLTNQPSYFPSSPTSTVFNVGSNQGINGSGLNYIAYLFATLPGISKVGSYTGTGADLNVDCGFSAGARFILIKRTDSTGDWYVWDSARGIVSGNDPYLLLNTTAAEVTSTDYIDPLSSGFTVTSSAPAALNASGGSYIFLAIS